MPERARRRHKIDTGGPWGSGLLLTGVILMTYGVSLLLARQGELHGALAWANSGVPLRGWGLLWLGAGIWSTARALMPPQRHIDVAPAVGILSLWGGLYFAYWLGLGLIHGSWTRDWIGGCIFFAFAAVIIEFSRCVNPPTGT